MRIGVPSMMRSASSACGRTERVTGSILITDVFCASELRRGVRPQQVFFRARGLMRMCLETSTGRPGYVTGCTVHRARRNGRALRFGLPGLRGALLRPI